MELIVGVLFVAGVLYASKKAVEHVGAEFRKSRPGRGGPRHAMAWFTGEAVRGFPVTRAGFQSGWLAHQTAMAQYHARREEARTSHLEARASILSELREHRRRQAEAQARIDAAQAPQDKPGDELASKRATRRPDGQPETEADRRFFDERESGYTGPLTRDGRRPNMNAPQERRDAETLAALRGRTPPSPEGRQHMARDDLAKMIPDDFGQDIPLPGYVSPEVHDPKDQVIHDGMRSGYQSRSGLASGTNGNAPRAGGSMSDTNYTTVVTAARAQADQADAAAADVRAQRANAEQVLEAMQAAGLDAGSLSDQADHVARLRAAEQALDAVTESGAQVSSGLGQRHGGIKQAHDDAPVEAAESGFYKE